MLPAASRPARKPFAAPDRGSARRILCAEGRAAPCGPATTRSSQGGRRDWKRGLGAQEEVAGGIVDGLGLRPAGSPLTDDTGLAAFASRDGSTQFLIQASMRACPSAQVSWRMVIGIMNSEHPDGGSKGAKEVFLNPPGGRA